MVKPKQKRTGKAPVEKSDASDCLINSPSHDDLHEDGDWIIVKKQKVTILVPPAPLSERSLTACQGPNDKELVPPETEGNNAQLPVETSTLHPSGNEHEKTTSLTIQKETCAVTSVPPTPRSTLADPSGNEHEKATSLTVQKETRAVRRVPPSIPKSTLADPSGNEQEKATSLTVQKETSAVRRVPPSIPKSTLANPSGNEQENATSLTVQKETCAVRRVPPPIPKSTLADPSGSEHEKATSLAVQKDARAVRIAPPPLPKPTLANPPRSDHRIESENPHQVSILKPHKLHGVSNTSNVIKQPRSLLAPRRSSNLVTLNQGLRASNLERKLERAGGLSKWLKSLGLGQFEKFFQGKRLTKFQLVNLTMKKLKDMGASAVGPRRKLIHAMDCVCQPYCFEVYRSL